MKPFRPPDRSLRRVLALLLMLSLLWQPALAAAQMIAMASDMAICTGTGAHSVDAHGTSSEGRHHRCTVCCCAPASGLPPSAIAFDGAEQVHAVATGEPVAHRLATQWVAPLGRGPPLS